MSNLKLNNMKCENCGSTNIKVDLNTSYTSNPAKYGYCCQNCGETGFINCEDLVNTPEKENKGGGLMGWVCPKCGRCYSPFTSMCPYCNNGNNMDNKDQKELSKFGKWFLNFMNKYGGAQIFILTGLIALALFLGPFFIQMYDILVSDANFASKALVMFGGVCVIFSIIMLVVILRMFKNYIK